MRYCISSHLKPKKRILVLNARTWSEDQEADNLIIHCIGDDSITKQRVSGIIYADIDEEYHFIVSFTTLTADHRSLIIGGYIYSNPFHQTIELNRKKYRR